MLFDLYRQKFGEYLPLIRRQDVQGLHPAQAPLWLTRPLGLEEVRKFAENMEFEAERFYRKAAENARDASVRAVADRTRRSRSRPRDRWRTSSAEEILTKGARAKEDETARRMFVLQYVQPGLVGLMDGSVSTLAPLFAAAFATHNTWETFLVGLAASVGAGISMGFAEALSDDGSLTGRGSPLIRGGVRRLMTAIGGLGHTLPYLIPHFYTATVRADRRGRRRACGDLLDPQALHGHAVSAGGVPDRGRRRAGVRGRDIDRECVIALRDAMFTLAHLSDPHLGAVAGPRWRELIGKRHHRLSQLAARAAPHPRPRRAAIRSLRTCKQQQPDHIAVTGDIANIALPEEFTARPRLAGEPRARPQDVTSVPGNHDIYVRSSAGACGAGNGARTCAATTATTAFPSCADAGRCCTNRLEQRRATAPFCATGRLGTNAACRAARDPRSAEGGRLFPCRADPSSAGERGRPLQAPDRRAALLALIAQHGAELLLHGHDHLHMLNWLPGADGARIPAVGVPSASAAPAHSPDPAAYHLFGSAGRRAHGVAN